MQSNLDFYSYIDESDSDSDSQQDQVHESKPQPIVLPESEPVKPVCCCVM